MSIKKGMLVLLWLCILLPDSLALLSWLFHILLTEAKASSCIIHAYHNSSKLKNIKNNVTT